MTTVDTSTDSPNNHAAFIWSVADLLRGNFKQSEYGRVILPLVVIRRLDCVLAPTKEAVLERDAELKGKLDNVAPLLEAASGEEFYNTSPLDLARVLDDPDNVAGQLRAYLAGFSDAARDIIEHFSFNTQIDRLDRANLLYLVLSRFVEIDLHPDRVSNLEMGYLYEELIRKFSELSNETAGEHFTPREVISLMVNLLFAEDSEVLTQPGVKRTLFDPACGTGGMLSVAGDHLREMNPRATLEVFGQELNPETYATCRADMLIKGDAASNIAFGNSFSDDGFPDKTFDYLLANPPFGVEWKMVADVVRDEAATKGFDGRFGAGLPRINDGSFLFLQHMIAHMKPASEGGSRLGIVFNGSPLFTGAAGSGESEIRRWIIENDWLDAVIALPDQLFYNTGISTYVWIVSNRKRPERQGTVQLIDARESFVKMRKSLGEKRKEISADQIADLVRLYDEHTEGERVKILSNASFGSLRIRVERPLRTTTEVNDDTLEAVSVIDAFEKLDDALRASTMDVLQRWRGRRFARGSEELIDEIGERLGEMPGFAEGARYAKRLTRDISDALEVTDPDGDVVRDSKGRPKPDPDLRDHENVPLPSTDVAGPLRFEPDVSDRLASPAYREAIEEYMDAEVLPYVPDAWVDHSKTKIGYEIPLTRHFYKYVPPRPLAEIDAEITELEAEIQELLREVTEDAPEGATE